MRAPMTSAYDETITESGEQKTTVSRNIAKLYSVDQELNNLVTLADMEESLSSRTSLATGASTDEEFGAISSVEINVLSGGSFDGDLLSIHQTKMQKTTDECEKYNKDQGNINCSTTNEMMNEMNDSSRSNKSENKESSSPDGSERNDEMRVSIMASSVRTSALEKYRMEQIEEQTTKDQRNQSVPEISVQERACGGIRTEEDLRDDAANVQACCENVEELHLDETQGDVEREIIQGRQNDTFYDAVRSGNARSVSALIASGCIQNLDEPDWNVSGDPPLLVAATNHCLPVLSMLLSNGCDPAVRSPRGETALHRVILNGGPGNVLKFVEDLLKYGCPPNVKEAGSGSTALHVLSRQLAHAPLKSLHRNFDAALKTLELLAKAGPVNAKDHQGRSALHILASSMIFDNNHKNDIESLIQTLLNAGADAALKNDRGETPLHESLECGALNTAALLISHTPTGITSRYGETPLHIASRKNYVDMVTKLLDHGEDPSMQDAGGNTPLHLASARGFHQTVSLLVTSPLAQLENVNIDGLTALQVAAESGFINAVRILLKAGADPSQTIHYCATILRRHPDISLLINHELTRRRQLAA